MSSTTAYQCTAYRVFCWLVVCPACGHQKPFMNDPSEHAVDCDKCNAAITVTALVYENGCRVNRK